MDIQDYYQKHLANSMHKRFNHLTYAEWLKVRKSYKRHLRSERFKSFTRFLWENAITIITFLIAVLAISYGIAIQIFKTLYPDA